MCSDVRGFILCARTGRARSGMCVAFSWVLCLDSLSGMPSGLSCRCMLHVDERHETDSLA